MKLKTLYIVVLALILASICIVMISSFSNIAVHASTLPEQHMHTIIIDAGHGGEDGGAEVDGVTEKDVNLSISRKLSDILRLCGYTVTEVRTSDVSVYDTEAETLREKKVSDLNNRVKLFNSSDDNIVVSIHQNKFDSSRYSGSQIFYSQNNDNSKDLGDRIRTAIIMLLQNDNTRQLKPAGKDIYVLDNASVPAVIVECGFLSNDAERTKLIDNDYQQKMAFAIAMGVIDYCQHK